MSTKKQYIVILTVLVIIGATSVLLFSSKRPFVQSDAAHQDEPIRLGVVASLSGAGANLGVPWVGGLQAAVDDINAKGGVNGRKLELDVQSVALDAKESVSATHYLLTKYNPDVFYVLFQASAAPMNPLLKDAKKPFFSLSFSRSIPEQNPYAFKGNYDSLTGCEALTRYMKEHGKYHQLGVLMSREDYNTKCLEGIKKVEPSVKEYWYNFGDTDFRTLLTKAHDDGVDMLEQVAIDFEYQIMFKQIHDLGYHIRMACNTASECMTQAVKDEMPSAALEGTMGIDFTPLNTAQSSFGQAFIKNHPTYDRKNLTNYTAMGYDSILLVAKALEHCASNDGTCIVQAMNSAKDYGSVLDSNGAKDRVQQFNMTVYEYLGGDWATQK